MFTSIISDTVSSLTISDALWCVLSAIIIGVIISFTYMFCGKHTKSFAISLVLLPIMVQIVIMLVNGNLGTGVAIMGAFSLIRFRSVPGTSREICAVFFAMAMGLATGIGYITFSFTATIIICILFIVLSKTKFGENSDGEKELKITIPENLDYTDVFTDVFQEYTKKLSLENVKTTNLGSMYQLSYLVSMKDPEKEKKFIDELRCRNGNLTISLGRQVSNKEEL